MNELKSTKQSKLIITNPHRKIHVIQKVFVAWYFMTHVDLFVLLCCANLKNHMFRVGISFRANSNLWRLKIAEKVSKLYLFLCFPSTNTINPEQKK